MMKNRIEKQRMEEVEPEQSFEDNCVSFLKCVTIVQKSVIQCDHCEFV